MKARRATFSDQEIQEHIDRLTRVLDTQEHGGDAVIARVLLRAEIHRMQEPLRARTQVDSVPEFMAAVTRNRR